VWLSFPPSTWQNLAGAVAVDLGGTVFLLCWLSRTPDGRLAFNPLTGLLGLYAVRRLLGLVYVVGQGTDLTSPFWVIPTAPYIGSSAKAEWITLAGTAAFCLGWAIAAKRRPGRPRAMLASCQRDPQLWMAYAVGLIGVAAVQLAPGVMSRLGNLASVTGDLAYGAGFALLAFSQRYGVLGPRRVLVYAALIPLGALAFTSGMKSSFFFALLPVGAAYLLRRPGRGLALSLAGVLFLLLFVYPYVQDFRATNWGPRPQGVSATEIAREVRHGVADEGVAATLRASWTKFELRFGGVGEAGAVVYLADRSGFMGTFFLQNLAYGFIPRFLWPEKPSWDPSGWFTSILTGGSGDYVPHGISSTALHIGPELYWSYGWPATVAGMSLLGLFYRRVSDWLLTAGASRPIYWAAWYGFLQSVTFIEEVRYNGAVLFPFILFANAVVVAWAVSVFLRPQVSRRDLSLGR
jgi:hypothetical protein